MTRWSQPKSPRTRLDAESYAQLRRQVLARNGWRCQLCGSSRGLEVHHLTFRSRLGADTEEDLISVCRDCHRAIHKQSSPSASCAQMKIETSRPEEEFMSRHFHYYDLGWEAEMLECPRYHWMGTFYQGTTSVFADFSDCHCPNCNIAERPILAMVVHPTRQGDAGLGPARGRGQGPTADRPNNPSSA
jgi:hypothetical protein